MTIDLVMFALSLVALAGALAVFAILVKRHVLADVRMRVDWWLLKRAAVRRQRDLEREYARYFGVKR